MDRSVLARKPMTELKDIAAHLELRGYQKLRKAELIDAIISSGSSAAAGDAGPDQPQLVPDEAPAAARRAEETARKVLPPGARDAEQAPTATEDDGEAAPSGGRGRNGTARRIEARRRAQAEQDAGGTGDAGREAGARPDEGREDGAPAGADAGGAEPADRSGPADRAEQGRSGDRSGRDGTGQDRSGAPQGSDGGGPDGGASDGSGSDGGGSDDGEDDGRSRRSRRDRRKRSRDRGEEQPAAQTPTAPPSGNDPGEIRAGVLDILPEGYGFLRTTGYLPGERDVYVSQGQIRKHGLRRGDVVQGPIRQQRSNEKVPALHHVQRVNGEELQDNQVPPRPTFDDLVVTHPDERLHLGGADAPLAARVIDLLAPIGRGQRALVVAPPRSGKTALLRQLGQAVADASPDSHVMAVLIDERPEEIAETTRSLPGEVIASSFDQPAEEHAQIAELALERAKRLVELGHDVVILLDSVTRLARAHGVLAQAQGRLIAPGVEAAALYPPKRAMAAARNTEDGGSLTVIATILAGTTSTIDQVVLEELGRVANAVVHLDPDLVRQRVEAPIAVLESGTDHEAALQDDQDLAAIESLRRILGGLDPVHASALLLDKLAQTETAEALLDQLRAAAPAAEAADVAAGA